jgi:hypothetical protein
MVSLSKELDKKKKEFIEHTTSEIQILLKYMKDNKSKLSEEEKKAIYETIEQMKKKTKSFTQAAPVLKKKRLNKPSHGAHASKPPAQSPQITLTQISQVFQTYNSLLQLLNVIYS